jgi:hypothetical protein
MLESIIEGVFRTIGVLICGIVAILTVILMIMLLVLVVIVGLAVLCIMIPIAIIYLLLEYVKYVVLKRKLKGFLNSLSDMTGGQK